MTREILALLFETTEPNFLASLGEILMDRNCSKKWVIKALRSQCAQENVLQLFNLNTLL